MLAARAPAASRSRQRTRPGGKIREALDRPVELDFDNVPLKDAVKHLRKSLKIPIVLSLRS